MNGSKGLIHFVSCSDVIDSKIRSKCCKLFWCPFPILFWMLPITPTSWVCNEDKMTQTKPAMFHGWWISGFLVGSDASAAVGCHRNACMRIGDAPAGGFFLVDFEGSPLDIAISTGFMNLRWQSKLSLKSVNMHAARFCNFSPCGCSFFAWCHWMWTAFRVCPRCAPSHLRQKGLHPMENWDIMKAYKSFVTSYQFMFSSLRFWPTLLDTPIHFRLIWQDPSSEVPTAKIAKRWAFELKSGYAALCITDSTYLGYIQDVCNVV